MTPDAGGRRLDQAGRLERDQSEVPTEVVTVIVSEAQLGRAKSNSSTRVMGATDENVYLHCKLLWVKVSAQ